MCHVRSGNYPSWALPLEIDSRSLNYGQCEQVRQLNNEWAEWDNIKLQVSKWSRILWILTFELQHAKQLIPNLLNRFASVGFLSKVLSTNVSIIDFRGIISASEVKGLLLDVYSVVWLRSVVSRTIEIERLWKSITEPWIIWRSLQLLKVL